VNCSNCGAPLLFIEHKDYFICEFCDSTYFPEGNIDGVCITDIATKFDCPVCSKPLVEARINGSEVLSCQKCRGILIKATSFVKNIELLHSRSTKPPVIPPPLNREQLERQIMCPQCNEKMDTHPYGGPGNIVIDNCPRCKVNWLDYNELNKIIRAPDRGYKRFSERYNLDYHFLPHKKPHRS